MDKFQNMTEFINNYLKENPEYQLNSRKTNLNYFSVKSILEHSRNTGSFLFREVFLNENNTQLKSQIQLK